MAGRTRAVNASRDVVTGRPHPGRCKMEQDVTLITGASSGIGEALARRIAQTKRNLVLVARRADRLRTLASSLEREYGIHAHVLAQDLVQPGAVSTLLDKIGGQGLVVDWLVNNAGFGTAGRFADLPVEHELEEVRLNVEVLVELTGRCVPGMVRRNRGLVMNIASVAGFAPVPVMALSAAPKAIDLSFTEAIADELRGTGVQVLCVCPGFTRTEFQDKAAVDVAGVPAFAWMSADAVATEALAAVGKRSVLVNGTLNSLMTSTLKFVPRTVLTRMVGSLMRSRTVP